MDWNATTEENRKALRRVVALLLALAGLAERTGGRSHAVRCLVLWLLRPGEAIARDYVAALTGNAVCAPHPAPAADDSAAEAMRMALGFRALAALLVALAGEAPAFCLPDLARLLYRLTGSLAASGAPLAAVQRRDSS